MIDTHFVFFVFYRNLSYRVESLGRNKIPSFGHLPNDTRRCFHCECDPLRCDWSTVAAPPFGLRENLPIQRVPAARTTQRAEELYRVWCTKNLRCLVEIHSPERTQSTENLLVSWSFIINKKRNDGVVTAGRKKHSRTVRLLVKLCRGGHEGVNGAFGWEAESSSGARWRDGDENGRPVQREKYV